MMNLVDVIGPREGRTPAAYADVILGAVNDALRALSLVTDDDDFMEKYVNPVVSVVRGGRGGDELYQRFSDPKNLPEGKHVSTPHFWATVAVAYALQAVFENDEGDISRAWTFAADGALTVGALLSHVSDQKAYTTGKSAPSKAGIAAKLASDPVQPVKPRVHELWRKWQSGVAIFQSGAAFDRHVVADFPVITSTKTVERWRKDWSDKK